MYRYGKGRERFGMGAVSLTLITAEVSPEKSYREWKEKNTIPLNARGVSKYF